jgi:hypothetical protein
MAQRMRDKLVQNVQPQMETGETIRNAVTGLAGPKWALAIGALGAAFSKPRAVILTDKNVYVMKMKGMGKPSEVENKYPLGTVQVSAGKGAVNIPLTVGTYKLLVSKLYRKEIEDLAANATKS